MTNKINKQNYKNDERYKKNEIGASANIIPYHKKYRAIAGSVTATILLQQLEYWFEKTKGEPFYKYLNALNKKRNGYKEGDSWTEELGFSAFEFKTAFSKIGTSYKSKKEFDNATDKFKNKIYCSYHDKISKKTWYFRSQKQMTTHLGKLTSFISPNQHPLSTQVKDVDLDIQKTTTEDYTVDSDYSLGATPLTADSPSSSLSVSTNNKKNKNEKFKVPSDNSSPLAHESEDTTTKTNFPLSVATASTPPQTPPQKKPSKNQKTTEQLIDDQIEKDVNEINKIFYDSDPTMDNLLFRNKNQRKATKELLKKYGKEQIKAIIYKAIEVRDKPYAPIISNPIELKAKLIKLKLFLEREENKGGKIIMGTDFSKDADVSRTEEEKKIADEIRLIDETRFAIMGY